MKYRVDYYYLATGMEGIADEYTLGEHDGVSKDDACRVAAMKRWPTLDAEGLRFVLTCLTATEAYDEALRHGEPRKYRSIVLWPDEVSTGKIPNESTDEHRSKEAAEHVCKMLRYKGLGLDGKIFPISTRVEPI